MHDLQLPVTLLTKAFEANNYRLKEPITQILYKAKNGVHTFGYNSAESEPILMESGALLGAGPGRFWAGSEQ